MMRILEWSFEYLDFYVYIIQGCDSTVLLKLQRSCPEFACPLSSRQMVETSHVIVEVVQIPLSASRLTYLTPSPTDGGKVWVSTR